MAGHGDVYWSECMTADADAAKAFYGELMGWDMLDGPMPSGDGRYIVARKGEEMICGIFPIDGAGSDGQGMPPMPAQWMTYLAVDDADAAAARATELGGKILQPPFDIPGVGRFVLIQDPSGVAVGIAQPA